jgi:hypothetical protein
MAQSDYYGTQASNTLRDKLSDTTDTVQQASADAYVTVRDTIEEQPFVAGILVGAVFGFALGALWKLESRQSLPAHAYDSFLSYARPPLLRLRDRGWW